MHLERKPAQVRRGVTQLMYVGDDDAVDKAVSTGKPVLIGIAVLLLWGIFSR